MLKRVEGEPAYHLDILFHRNDPKDIYGNHGLDYAQSQRQPDIIVTSRQSARRAGTPNENASHTWDEICLRQATQKPISRFQWYDVVASVEMESDLKPIPVGHIDRMGKTAENRRPPNIVDMAPKSKKRSMRSDSMPSAVEPAVKRLKTEPLSQPTGRGTVTEGTNDQNAGLSYIRRRSSRVSPLCGSPIIAVTPPKIPKIVQCGLYAAEILCGSYGASHSINLFISSMLTWLPFCVARRSFCCRRIPMDSLH